MDEYICIKEVIMDGTYKHEFHEGETYKEAPEEMQSDLLKQTAKMWGYIVLINNSGDAHSFDKEGFSKYFKLK